MTDRSVTSVKAMRQAVYGMDAVILLLVIAGEGMLILSYRRKKKEFSVG